MFVQIQAPFVVCTTRSQEFPSYSYVLHKFCELLARRFDRFPPEVEGQAVRSGQNLAQHLHGAELGVHPSI
jgi:hypothetical protein